MKSQIPDKKFLRSLINNGVKFIYEKQLEWGEIVNYSVSHTSKNELIYRSTVFPTVFILLTLNQIQGSNELTEINKRGLEFILMNKEHNYWRYFGKGTELPPDFDTTSCCYRLLHKNKIEFDYNIIELFLSHRNIGSKLFHTWIENPPSDYNDIDSIVNSNVHLLFTELGKSPLIPEISNFLISESLNLQTQLSQLWYFSSQLFCYNLSKIYSEESNKIFERSKESITKYLLYKQDYSGGWDNSLETAFALTALLNFGYCGDEIVKGINYLLEQRDTYDGPWQKEFFYPVGGNGSEELTTAVCIECINKYLRKL